MLDPITLLTRAIQNLATRVHRLETREPRMPSSQTPTLIGGWASLGGGYSAPAYYISAGTVYLSGWITGGAVGTAAFTLPVAHRPTATHGYIQPGGAIEVRTNGDVVPVNGASPYSLDGIVFRAA